MFKRFMTAFALILLYMMIWFAIIYFSGAFILIPFMFLGFIPFMGFATRKAFFFKGEGHPVSEDALREEILSLNVLDLPIIVHEKDKKLIATWRYVEAKWWEELSVAGLEEVYELHVKLNPRKKTVKLIDITRSVEWNAGPEEVSLKKNFFRGILFEVKVGKQWGIKENFQPGKIYDFTFSSMEIKTPVMNTILQNGWHVQFASW